MKMESDLVLNQTNFNCFVNMTRLGAFKNLMTQSQGWTNGFIRKQNKS
jgi:hypothetical protein